MDKSIRKIIYRFITTSLTCVITLIFLLACSTTPHYDFEGKNSEEAVIQEFEKIVKDNLPDDRSISAAIVKGDKVIWSKAFGVSNLTTHTMADTATIYRTGSISKSFTAFLMMLLVQDGVISLTDPVEKYLPEIKQLKGYMDNNKITFQQLATHTAGLTREPELPDAAAGPIEKWEVKILASIPTTSMESKPGERYSYSNIGYGILGLALSKAAHKPFMDLIKERIFVPLHMNSSYFVIPQEKLPDLSAGIQELSAGGIDTKTPQEEHRGRGYKVPNGGIYSTPNDLAKFMIYLFGDSPTLLSYKNLEMMENKTVTIGDQVSYGIGFFINQEGELTMINHGGAVAGYTANFALIKENKYGIILMRNYAQRAPDITALSTAVLKALCKVQ